MWNPNVMRSLALTGFLLAGSVAIAQSPESFETFSDPACGVSFRHPRSWVVVRNPAGVFSADYTRDQVACSFGLQPRDWTVQRGSDRTGLLPEFPVEIAVVRRPFLEVAQRAGFSRVEEGAEESLPGLQDGDWMIAVRQGNAPAEQFRTSCCQAVIGETWGHAIASDGSKATVTATLAVVNDRRRHSAILEGRSTEGAAVVKAIAASVRFSRQKE
jgi:hypothetical protein